MLRRVVGFAAVGVTAAVIALAVGAYAQPVRAQVGPTACKANLIIDRSGSVSDDDLRALFAQIEKLFMKTDPQKRYEIAFWTFSSASGEQRKQNYNAPYNTYVGLRGSVIPRDFADSLSRIRTGDRGGTNYEQGFAHDQGKQNTNTDIRNIASESDVILFITDGVPNTPGNGDNNPTAVRVAREAVEKYKAANKDLMIVGGLIGTGLSEASIREVITGNRNLAAVDGPSSNSDIRKHQYEVMAVPSYGTADKLEELLDKISEKCGLKVPTDPDAVYNLEPRVSTDNRVVSNSGNVTFNYSVQNTGSHTSRMTQWTVKRVLVGRDQSVAPITSSFSNGSGRPYRDDYSCAQLLSLIGGNGSCTDAASGQRIFTPGSTDMASDLSSIREATIDDDWEAGTKLCYVLTIVLPTQLNSPRDRFSRVACTTIGKMPSVQVHGGDVWVGRKFAGATDEGEVPSETKPANIYTSMVTKSDGHSYGSWAEYGVFATGKITGFSSKSGLADPLLTLPDWNKLTFANTESDLGQFVEPDSVQNTMPNVVVALLDGREVHEHGDLNASDSFEIGESTASGLYRKATGNLVLKASTLPKDRSIIVHVPEGKVTIEGDIRYDNGPYTNISEIPQLIIIAGSVDIKPDVTQLDAWLIAGGSQSGVIRTCDTPGPLTSEICNRPLRINGPVMARHLELRRTGGAGIGGAAGDPAEVISLRADMYLWAQSEGKSGVRAQTTHVVEMPPYF